MAKPMPRADPVTSAVRPSRVKGMWTSVRDYSESGWMRGDHCQHARFFTLHQSASEVFPSCIP